MTGENDRPTGDTDLPVLREYQVPSYGEIPSRGFITPHQRASHEIVENLTDTDTAMRLYALIHEGGHANYETALKAAIDGLYREIRPEKVYWRYYCYECEFIGCASKTHAVAEAGSQNHASVCEEDGVAVFAYDTDDWDPENVEKLVERYETKTDRSESESDDR